MQGNTEYHGRQRFRPWLITKIDSGKFPGLEWLDKSQHIFRVPWKHGGKQDWSEQNSLIFKEWALHTGRYRQGVDKDEWPVWKTRFRCAMNKLTDIQEIKEKNQLDGEEPYRVYTFLPNKCRNNTVHNHKSNLDSTNRYKKIEPVYQSSSDGPLNLSSSNKFSIPETVRDINFGSLMNDRDDHEKPTLTSDLGVIDMDDLLGTRQQSGTERQANYYCNNIKEEVMDTTDGSLITEDNLYPTDMRTGAPVVSRDCSTFINPQLHILQHKEKEPQEHEMIVRLQFRQQVVAQHHITSLDGVRLYYGQSATCMTYEDNEKAYGSCHAQPIEFPYSELKDNTEQMQLTQKLLGHLDRGVTLESNNGNIYAVRNCRVVVFVATPESNKPIKIHRSGSSIKIFDYNAFRVALQNYASGYGPKPSAQILLGFGQNWTNLIEPYNNLLISATIFHPKAIYELSKISGNGLLTPPVQISDSDEMDKYIKIYKDITARLA